MSTATYPYVPAWFDGLGPRKGPTLGLMYHMAEGGGTVGYLDKKGNPPARGVSVHAVCDYNGVVTRMLDWGDASGSLNPADRSIDTGYYGHSALVAVLGPWWPDPNSVVLSMEIEGFAKAGPNPKQVAGAIAWGLDMRARYPSLVGALGHTDQTDYKPCPGTTDAMKSIFDGVGGHGLWTKEGPMIYSNDTPMLIDLPAGTQLYDTNGLPLVKSGAVQTGIVSPFEAAFSANFHARATFALVAGKRVIAFAHNDPLLHTRPIPAPTAPPADCTAAVKAATDPLTARIAAIKAKVAAGAVDVADD